MRKSLVLAMLVVLCCSMTAMAAVPDPARSGCQIKGQELSCQFRFRADGGLDKLTVAITLRDAFDTPVPSCSVNAGWSNLQIKPGEAGAAMCSCCPAATAPNAVPNKGAVTNAAGVAQIIFAQIGGRGIVDICVTAHCVGNIEICCFSDIHFTSPDLNGSCDLQPPAAASTNVVDLGIWAGCLPPAPYCESSDYNCDNTVNVVDLGVFAGGLVLGCNNALFPCP